MSVGVFTPGLRFKWVKGQVTSGEPDEGFVACGDGTAFPMEVTVDQLAEIMYRVKDSQWVSGSAEVRRGNVEYVEGVPQPAEWESGTTLFLGWPDMPETLVNYEHSYPDTFYSRRGYSTTKRGVSPTSPMSDYGSNVFGDPYYVGPTVYGTIYTLAVREASSELAMWANRGYYEIGDTPGIGWQMAAKDIPYDRFRTGFSLYAGTDISGTTPPSRYGPYTQAYATFEGPTNGVYPGIIALTFSGEVAWVDDDASGNPLSSGNRLYIGVRFSIEMAIPWEDSLLFTEFFNTDASILENEDAWGTDYGFTISDTGGKVRLKLSGVDNYATAKIFGVFEDSLFDGAVSYGEVTDFDFEATKWWPYAKDSPAVPVWNADTGERL